MKENLIRKLTSRKFWLAVAAFVTELIVAFRGDAELAETVAAVIMAGATIIAYILGEGLIDSAAAGNTSSTAQGAVQQSLDRHAFLARQDLPHEGKVCEE